MSGKAAFLAPLVSTAPFSGMPPRITIFCIGLSPSPFQTRKSSLHTIRHKNLTIAPKICPTRIYHLGSERATDSPRAGIRAHQRRSTRRQGFSREQRSEELQLPLHPISTLELLAPFQCPSLLSRRDLIHVRAPDMAVGPRNCPCSPQQWLVLSTLLTFLSTKCTTSRQGQGTYHMDKGPYVPFRTPVLPICSCWFGSCINICD